MGQADQLGMKQVAQEAERGQLSHSAIFGMSKLTSPAVLSHAFTKHK
jgi:hypothetical protein